MSTDKTKALTLMVQGTTSDAGKSALVTGICRVLQRRGKRVAPFKPQNMANNSAVTIDGGEIGRAQALQAQAAGLEPHTDMNPVLIKPSSNTGAQIIIQGHPVADMQAMQYHGYKKVAMDAVLESHARLEDAYECIVVEGAGSPAEINLRDNDIANMGFAEAVDCPVIIVADIDKGGVFAHLVGTLELLSESEQARVCGFVINRFRGDTALLQPGLDWLQERTQKPVLGVLPYLHNLHLDQEDAIAAQQVLDSDASQRKLNVVVPVLPRISNHTDFDPLRMHPNVNLSFVSVLESMPAADLLILPGSKNVRADLQRLRDNGWLEAIKKHLRYGGKLLGICGGYQMLGMSIADPLGIEDEAGESPGLALMDFTTELRDSKQLHRVVGEMSLAGTVEVSGYEIHCGISSGAALQKPLVQLSDGRSDGAVSEDNQVIGTYLHGLFENPQALVNILAWAGMEEAALLDPAQERERAIDRFADCVEEHLDLVKLFACFDGDIE